MERLVQKTDNLQLLQFYDLARVYEPTRKLLVEATAAIIKRNKNTLAHLELFGFSDKAEGGHMILLSLYQSNITGLKTINFWHNKHWWNEENVDIFLDCLRK